MSHCHNIHGHVNMQSTSRRWRFYTPAMLDALNELLKEIQAVLRFALIDRRYNFLLMDTFMYKCLGVLGTQDPNLYMDMGFQIHVQVYRGRQKYTVEDTFEWYASTGCIGRYQNIHKTDFNEHLPSRQCSCSIIAGQIIRRRRLSRPHCTTRHTYSLSSYLENILSERQEVGKILKDISATM
ncbi:hypothetical protein SARC_04960, partial [Sphaeroforma arctica JP610]